MNAQQARERYSLDNYAQVVRRARELATSWGCCGDHSTTCSDPDDPAAIGQWCAECCLGFLVEAHERGVRRRGVPVLLDQPITVAAVADARRAFASLETRLHVLAIRVNRCEPFDPNEFQRLSDELVAAAYTVALVEQQQEQIARQG